MKRLALTVICLVLALNFPATVVGQSSLFTLKSLEPFLEGFDVEVLPAPPQQSQPTPRQPQSNADSSVAAYSADVRLIQIKLNELGYDAGSPDGLMGPKTHQAIIEYQAARGERPTGVLTPVQQQALVSAAIGNPAAQAPATTNPGFPAVAASSPTAFDILYDTDLPYNDYRHGMDDPSLAGVSFESCQATCAADGMCRAFTYNATHEVCFLKSDAAEPVPFDNAISGIKRAGAATPGAGFATTSPGFLSPPGVPGAGAVAGIDPATQAASGYSGYSGYSGQFAAARALITPPMVGIRGVAPVMLDDRLLTGFPIAHGDLQGDIVEIGPRELHASGANLAFYIDLAIIKQWPETLADDYTASEYAMRFLSPELQAAYLAECQWNCGGSVPFAQWAGSNEFEREASYQRFMQEIAPVLIGMGPDLPIRLVQVVEAEIQSYDSAQQAFPLSERRSLDLLIEVEPLASVNFEFDYEMPPSVPVPEAQAPAFLAPLQQQERRAFLAFDISIGDSDERDLIGRPSLTVSLERQRLYADATLQQPIADFPEAAAPTLRALAPVGGTQFVYNQHGGMPDSAREATMRLAKLLALRGNPALLQHYPAYFADLLPAEQTAAYLDENGDWVGRDEFEQTDSERRFIEERGPVILQLVPQGEIEIAYLQNFGTNEYADGGFLLQGVDWTGGGFSTTDYLYVPTPLEYPERWMLSEEEARAYRELERQQEKPPYLRTNFVIRDAVTGADGRTVLDVAVRSLSIVSGDDLQNVIATLPLPEGAISADRQTAFTALEVVDLEPELLRLYAVREDPALLDDPAFVHEGFLVRQVIENHLIEERDSRLHTSWPGFFRSTMLTTPKPSAQMLDLYKQSVLDRIPLLPPLIHTTVVCPSGVCGVGEEGRQPVVNLGEMLQSPAQWNFARTHLDISEDLLRFSANPVAPADIRQIYSGATFPAYLLFMPNENWKQIVHSGAPADSTAMDVELEIVAIEVRRDPNVVLVGVQPYRAILHSASAGEYVIPLEGGEIIDTAAAPVPFAHDILGISLGMGRDETVGMLETRQRELPGARLYSASAEESASIRAYVLENAETPRSPVDYSEVFEDELELARDYESADRFERVFNEGMLLVQYGIAESVPSTESLPLTDQTAAFYDAGGLAIAISRYQNFGEPIDAEAVRAQIIERYGEPHATVGWGMMVWAEDAAIREVLQSGQAPYEPCGFGFDTGSNRDFIPWREYGGDQPIAANRSEIILPDLSNLSASCGRALLVGIEETSVELHLIDTGWAFARVTENATADNAKAESEAGEATQGLAF